MRWSSQPLTARAEGGTHDGEEFDVTDETVGLLLNSRQNPVVLEYYELVLYMRGNLLVFVREYDSDERRVAFGGTEAFRAAQAMRVAEAYGATEPRPEMPNTQ
jgi:hypothetical protein